jgi:hypothetical protein
MFVFAGSVPVYMLVGQWLLMPSHLSRSPISILHYEIWVATAMVAYILGVIFRFFKECASEAFLNWLVKPLLLLFSLLFVTLGVYINLYMFSMVDMPKIVAAAFLPLLGYVLGFMVSCLSRQDADYKKTLVTETTVWNCLLVLVMIRFSMPQPAADIMSCMPIWILLFTPMPFMMHYVLKRVKRCMWKSCAKRKEKKYRHFSIVSSLLNVTNVTSLSNSMSPKVSSPMEESKDLVDEKVTSL